MFQVGKSEAAFFGTFCFVSLQVLARPWALSVSVCYLWPLGLLFTFCCLCCCAAVCFTAQTGRMAAGSSSRGPCPSVALALSILYVLYVRVCTTCSGTAFPVFSALAGRYRVGARLARARLPSPPTLFPSRVLAVRPLSPVP